MLALCAPGGYAYTAEEGVPQFAVSPQLDDPAGPPEAFRVVISMGGPDCGKSVLGRATIHLGPGLSWVSGDSVHVGHVSTLWDGPRDDTWAIVLNAASTGSTEIRASLTVDVGNAQVDEDEALLPIEVTADRVRAGIVKSVRHETIRHGRRYRYGGLFLVPIEGPEDFTSQGIVERARAVREEAAACPECKGKEQEVPFVVFIDSRGALHSYRPLSLAQEVSPPTPAMVSAAEEALKRWKFSPGRTRTRSVADWLVVRVRVNPTTR
jgi:hypothetical protein